MAMAQQRLADTGAALEGMVHVTENHQIGGSVLGHAVQGKGQILIPPVHRRGLPVTSAGTGGIRSQARGTAVGHHDQGLISGNFSCGLHDSLG